MGPGFVKYLGGSGQAFCLGSDEDGRCAVVRLDIGRVDDLVVYEALNGVPGQNLELIQAILVY